MHKALMNAADWLATMLALSAITTERAVITAWDNMPQFAGFLSASWMLARIINALVDWRKKRGAEDGT